MIPRNPSAADSDVPTVAGRYRLREVLGRGGMGTVWLAEDLLLRREVALKELLFPDTLTPEQQEELRQRSLREAQAAARISSPHAVKVYDVVTDGGRPWIVMERHHGRTLSEIIRADGPRSPAETARIGLAILAALENAHAAGIVHRDVKPSNVLVRDDGHVTLTDFGIARGIEDTTITRTGMIVGSPAYVAPERATGAPALPPSDLWALGATLYTAVEGHPPYDRGDPMHTLAAVMYEAPEPCRAAGPLAPAIRALLAKDPADRPEIPAARAALSAVATASEGSTRTELVSGPPQMGDRTVLLPSGPAPKPPPEFAPSATTGPPVAAAPVPPAILRERPPLRPAPPRQRRSRPQGHRAGALLLVVALVAGAMALFAAFRDRPSGGQARPKTTSSIPAAAKPSPRETSGAAAADPGRTDENTGRTDENTGRTDENTGRTDENTGRTDGARAGSSSPSASASRREATSGATSAAGLITHTDPSVGWSIGKPAGWRVRERGSLTDLIDPAGGRYLRIDSIAEAGSSAIGAWQELEMSFRRKHADYTQIRMETISWRGFDDVADWEFGYRQGEVELHAIDRGIVAGGRGYALYFQSPEDQWTASQPLLEELFGSFQPAPERRDDDHRR